MQKDRIDIQPLNKILSPCIIVYHYHWALRIMTLIVITIVRGGKW